MFNFALLYLPDINLLSEVDLTKIFFHSTGCQFILLKVSYAEAFNFMKSHLSVLGDAFYASVAQKLLPVPIS